jgi:photosystem II stability/assembly factor-like uncharacterized protein
VFRLAALLAACSLVPALVAGASPGGWRETGAPEGGPIDVVAVGGDGTLYAGAHAGVFVRPDGARWRRASLPFAGEAWRVLDVAAGAAHVAYASVLDDDIEPHLLATSDGGTSWRSASTGIPDDVWVTSLTVGRDAPLLAYAVADGDVYRTRDGRASWNPLAPVRDRDAGPPRESETQGDGALIVAPDPLSADTLYAGGYRGIFTSTDAGASWTKRGVGFPSRANVIALAVLPTTPRRFLAGTNRDGVFASVDGGATWSASRSGLPVSGTTYAPVYDLVLDARDPQKVHAATSAGPAVSRDGGASWRVADGRRPRLTSLARDASRPGTLYAGSLDRGVLRSDDGGEGWRAANEGLHTVVPIALAPVPGAPRAAYLGTYLTGLVATHDAGARWTPAIGSPAPTVLAIVVDPSNARNVWAATPDVGVLRSRDGGRTWRGAGRAVMAETARPRGLSPEVHALALDPRNPRVLYVASQYGYGGAVSRSADGGGSWRRVFATESVLDVSLEALAVDPTQPATIYAGTGWPSRHASEEAWGVFVSRDSGRTWTRVVAGLRDRDTLPGINALAVSPKTGEAYAATSVGVFRLRRGATTWTRLAAGLPRVEGNRLAAALALAIDPRSGAVCVATTAGVYDLRGARWRQASPLLAGRRVDAVAFSSDGSRLFAATTGHVFVLE